MSNQTITPNMRDLAAETRRSVATAVNVKTPIRTRRRDPDEVPSLKVAIVNNCSECMGHAADPGCGSIARQVRECSATECWLWPWRTGQLDPTLRKEG